MQQQPYPQNYPPYPKNHNGFWAIAGVLVGGFLPIFLCCGLAMIPITLGTIGSANNNNTSNSMEGLSFSGNRTTRPVYLSGPSTGDTIAMIDVNGPIVSSGTGGIGEGGIANAKTIVRQIKAAKEDTTIKAIILRVNSPGGSVVASDEIYHALKNCGKPVVALMGETAASGGVYVSMGAKYIVAHPNTFTGSVGVIFSLTNYEELYKKIGLRDEVIKSGKLKDIGSGSRQLTDEERQLLQGIIDSTYEDFVKIVADARKLKVEEVKKFADGRILTGKQALEIKLVDKLGYESDAVKMAAELAGIKGNPRIVGYRASTPFESWFGELGASLISQWLGLPPQTLVPQPEGLSFR